MLSCVLLSCRRGERLATSAPAAGAQWREPSFNFYDARLMGNAWCNEKDPSITEMFFRLLAVCHTIVPDGPAEERKVCAGCTVHDAV